MPNFKALIDFDSLKSHFIDEKQLKFMQKHANNEYIIEFNFLTSEKNNIRLLHTKSNNEGFFIQIKKLKDCYLIKLDKHSRIKDLSSMIAALECFNNHFCTKTIHTTLAQNSHALKQNVIDAKILLEKIKNYKKVIIEIGFGSARGLCFLAQNNKNDTLIVGIEVYHPAILQASKLLKDYENVVLLNDDARFIFDILPPSSIDMILLHFPVPWNDSKSRRVISQLFFQNIAYVLKKDGIFHLRTDDFEYFDDAKNMLNDFDLKIDINKQDNVISKYEARWLKMQKDIYDIKAKYNGEKIVKNNENFEIDGVMAKNIKPVKIVEKDYFLSINNHYEIEFFNKNTYKNKPQNMLKISYGSFTKPFSGYLLDNEFLFTKPYSCTQNIKALKQLKFILG